MAASLVTTPAARTAERPVAVGTGRREARAPVERTYGSWWLKQLLRAISWSIAALPISVALWIGRCIGWLIGSVVRYHRNEAQSALRKAFPEMSARDRRQLVRRMYTNLGMNLVETMLVAAGKSELLASRLVIKGEQHAKDALAEGKGVCVLTAHIGNWELLGLFATLLGDYPPLTILVKEIRNRAINELITETRSLLGIRIMNVRQSMRAPLRALQKGEIVSFLLDQNMVWNEGTFVQFFGRTACTTPGLAQIAAKSGSPVLPVFIRRLPDHRHEISIHPAIAAPEDRRPETIHDATQVYTTAIERAIRQQPDQWIWIHRRWKTQPRDIPKGQVHRFVGVRPPVAPAPADPVAY